VFCGPKNKLVLSEVEWSQFQNLLYPKRIERKSEFFVRHSEFCKLCPAGWQKEKKCSKDIPTNRIKENCADKISF
jgi:hypothetical protein